MKNAIGILIRIALNLYIFLGSMVSLTILILPIQEHIISFHLLVPSSISFISVLWFLEYRSFASLCRFIPRYFILFDVKLNGLFHTLLPIHQQMSVSPNHYHLSYECSFLHGLLLSFLSPQSSHSGFCKKRIMFLL